MTAHDDMVDALAMSLRYSMEQMELTQRITNFYSHATVAIEALWGTSWIILIWVLLQLVQVQQVNLRGDFSGFAFVFAGIVVVMLVCHGHLIRRAQAHNGHWNGRFKPYPQPVSEATVQAFRSSLNL